jgi:hypothetical protein
MATSVPESRPLSLVQSVVGIWTSPSETYAAILRAPAILVPLAAVTAMQLAFTGIWLHKVDAEAFMKAQIEERGQWETIPVEQRASVLEQQSKALPYFGWGGALLGAPVLILVVGGVYLFVFRFFHASDLDFKKSLSIVTYTFLAVGLVTAPLTLLVLFLRDDWSLDPQRALQANLSLLMDREDTSKWLWSMAESLDLFSFWAMWLLACAYAAASSKSWTWAIPGIVTPWVLYVACKTALTALF